MFESKSDPPTAETLTDPAAEGMLTETKVIAHSRVIPSQIKNFFKFPARPSQILVKFSQNVQLYIDVLDYAVERFTAILSVFSF